MSTEKLCANIEEPPPYSSVNPSTSNPPNYSEATEQTPILELVPVAEDVTFDDQPVRLTCPHCSHHVLTAVKYRAGSQAYLASTAICAVGILLPLLWLGFCLIPFRVKDCLDVEHRCPECFRCLGHYQRIDGHQHSPNRFRKYLRKRRGSLSADY